MLSGKKKNVTAKPKFCVLGAGNGGLAMAGHLAILGFSVNIYNHTEERIWAVKERGGIEVEGEIKGFGRLRKVTSNIKEAIEGVDVLMVVVPATGHRSIAEICCPHLRNGQIVILNPGRTCGAIEFKQVLNKKGCKADVTVAEAQTLLYVARVTDPGQVKIFRIKNSVPVASIAAYRIPKILNVVRKALPWFVPGDNVFKTSLSNVGAVFHPAITVLNAGWIEEDVSNFQFYIEGCSPSICRVLEKIDAERIRVAAALGIKTYTAREWFYLAYGVEAKDLFQAIHSNSGYKGIMAPASLNVRYIKEDVPMSLVPIASLGSMLGVPTPTTNNIVNIASVLNDTNYWKQGRTVEKLGIAKMSVKQLRSLAIGEGVEN